MNGKVLHIAGKLSFTETRPFLNKNFTFLITDFLFVCKTHQLKKKIINGFLFLQIILSSLLRKKSLPTKYLTDVIFTNILKWIQY